VRCLDDALVHETGERLSYGIRGGYTATQRVTMIKHRPHLALAELAAAM
jgi:hypothetical protein